MKKQLKLPNFKNEEEERNFWSKVKLDEYFDPSDAQSVAFPNLKPTSMPISIRLPVILLNRIKERANEIDVPYQSLIKTHLQKAFFKS